MGFRFYHQHDSTDCGPACLQMIARHYGKRISLAMLRERCYITREGVSMLSISDTAESIGFKTLGVKITLKQLMEETPLPCIAYWNQRHFVVIYKIIKRPGKEIFCIADPAHGKLETTDPEHHAWAGVPQRGDLSTCTLLLSPSGGLVCG